jgi:glycosyltransferase involved in cell wall biosynthesis
MMTAWGSDLLVTPQRSWLRRRLTAWVLGRARVVTGDSFSLLEAARKLRPDVRTQLIHWGVDLARFSPSPWPEKPGFQVVSLRSWEPNYRIDTIIEALALVRSRFPAVTLVLHLLGGGSQENLLKKQVASLGLDECVRFHGKLDEVGMAAIYQGCKLSISVPESDATSVSVLESMACGLAVIASDLPANRQWLAPDLLVPAGRPEVLAEVWGGLLEHEARAAEVAVANAERMRSEGDRRLQMDAVDELYRELLGSGQVA